MTCKFSGTCFGYGTKFVQGIDLAELCITSSAEIDKNFSKETTVQTVKLEGIKCPVCWKIFSEKCPRHS